MAAADFRRTEIARHFRIQKQEYTRLKNENEKKMVSLSILNQTAKL